MSNFEPMSTRRTAKVRVNRDGTRSHRAKSNSVARKRARKMKATR